MYIDDRFLEYLYATRHMNGSSPFKQSFMDYYYMFRLEDYEHDENDHLINEYGVDSEVAVPKKSEKKIKKKTRKK